MLDLGWQLGLVEIPTRPALRMLYLSYRDVIRCFSLGIRSVFPQNTFWHSLCRNPHLTNQVINARSDRLACVVRVRVRHDSTGIVGRDRYR